MGFILLPWSCLQGKYLIYGSYRALSLAREDGQMDELLSDIWSAIAPLVLASTHCHGNFDVLFLDEFLWV